MTQSTRLLIAVTASLASLGAAALAADPPSAKLNLPIAPGPFKPTMASLAAYQVPDWFGDAKFGIWSHWGPQSVPMAGGWYARDMYKEGTGIYTLVDNVSKNGNLLLNVVQRPDCSLDPEVERMLGELAEWTALNGEAIYGSRPWLVYGESQIKVKAGNYDEVYKFDAREIRFTTQGATLDAFALGWPEDGKILIRSLGKPAGADVNNVASVSLLGYDGKLVWKQTPDGLTVDLPAITGAKITVALKITGTNLKNIPFDLK